MNGIVVHGLHRTAQNRMRQPWLPGRACLLRKIAHVCDLMLLSEVQAPRSFAYPQVTSLCFEWAIDQPSTNHIHERFLCRWGFWRPVGGGCWFLALRTALQGGALILGCGFFRATVLVRVPCASACLRLVACRVLVLSVGFWLVGRRSFTMSAEVWLIVRGAQRARPALSTERRGL